MHDWQSACCVTLDRNTTWHGVLPSRNKLASALSANASLIDPPKPPASPVMAAVITAPATTIGDTGQATRKRRSRSRKQKSAGSLSAIPSSSTLQPETETTRAPEGTFSPRNSQSPPPSPLETGMENTNNRNSSSSSATTLVSAAPTPPAHALSAFICVLVVWLVNFFLHAWTTQSTMAATETLMLTLPILHWAACTLCMWLVDFCYGLATAVTHPLHVSPSLMPAPFMQIGRAHV